MKLIILHHTASGDVHPQFEAVIAYHKKKFHVPNTAYHVFIEKDGKVIRANAFDQSLPHAGNSEVNKNSIAVALAGDFTLEEPTRAQITAFIALIEDLKRDYGFLEIKLHSEVRKGFTECPGKDLRLYLPPHLSPESKLKALQRALLRATGTAARAIGRAIARIIHISPFSLPPS